jgi:hypothetical protein
MSNFARLETVLRWAAASAINRFRVNGSIRTVTFALSLTDAVAIVVSRSPLTLAENEDCSNAPPILHGENLARPPFGWTFQVGKCP